jgi:hypothetical protein
MFRRRRGLDRSAARAVEAKFTVALSPDDMLSGLPVEFRDEVHTAHATATEALIRAEQVDSRLKGLESQRIDPDAQRDRLQALEQEFDRLAAVLRSSHNLAFHRRETKSS